MIVVVFLLALVSVVMVFERLYTAPGFCFVGRGHKKKISPTLGRT